MLGRSRKYLSISPLVGVRGEKSLLSPLFASLFSSLPFPTDTPDTQAEELFVFLV